jgi:hypothetical protein
MPTCIVLCACANSYRAAAIDYIKNHIFFMMATDPRSSKNSVSTGNTSSWFSVKSAKSAVEQIPKTRACPWVAQWFTIPQAILKPVQMVRKPLFCLILRFSSILGSRDYFSDPNATLGE